jgi:two-component system chemotaxis response regulator CheY
MARILAVDDSPSMRQMVSIALTGAGYEVEQACDGVEALAIAQKSRFDLVITDVNMPNMDGITLVRKIRETDKNLPLMMVTTEAEKSRVLEAIKAGVNNYVVKPFTAETLSEKITQTLAKFAAAGAG